MEPIVIAILFSVSIYLVLLALIPKKFMKKKSTDYTQQMLQALEEKADTAAQPADASQDDSSVLLARASNSGLVARIFFMLPGTKKLYPLMLKAGMEHQLEKFFIVQVIIFILLIFLFKKTGIYAGFFALALSYLIAYWRVRRRIRVRNEAFLKAFPDALDMIVRSVRSGYPLNSAVKMVAENMQPPVSTEFKQVADETAYGSNLVESLSRLSHRVDEPDVHFFVVMLTVQQDVGGNLSESLTNLSSIIRKRRHLRLKVKAMTSEGRATAYVLGSLPIGMFGIIHMVQPKHLDPMFNTDTGNIMLGVAIGILALGAGITWRLVNPEI